MLRIVLGIVGALLVAIIPIYVTFHLNQSKPEVKYTISEGIPILTEDGTAYKNVQQLEVRNVGDALAESIVVKVSRKIDSYEIMKHIASDKVDVFDEKQPIEIIYPELPPDAGFKIILKSTDSIRYEDLAISHKSGSATKALSSDRKTNPWGIAFVAFYFVAIVVFGGLSLNIMRTSSIDTWKWRATSQTPERILNLRKPWYVSEKKWKTLHTEVIKNKLKDEHLYTHNMVTTMPNVILCSEKPGHVEDLDWKEITNLAIDRLEKLCSEMARSYHEKNVLELLQLKKPPLFPADKWDELKNSASDRYALLKKQSIHIHDIRGIFYALKEKKPAGVTEAAWAEFTEHLQRAYSERLLRDLPMEGGQLEFLYRQDLSVLSTEQRDSLRADVIRRVKYQELLRLLELVLNNKAIDEQKPEPLSDLEWLRLGALAKKAATLAIIQSDEKEIGIKLAEVTTAKEEVLLLKQKIERQLSIVNEILSDPTSIDRIESYDDAFAPGNLDNLRKVSRILSEKK